MFAFLSTASFFNVWYWALSLLLWTFVSNRVLGVPYDMLLRAERSAPVAADVDRLATIGAGRLAALGRGLGPILAALAGFVLAALGTAGFGLGSEIAQAAFMLMAPLAFVGASTIRLAATLARDGTTGPELRRRLARRRACNQATAIVAIAATALVAAAHAPRSL